MNLAPAREKIIVALDARTAAEAERLVDTLAPQVGYFKIGLELMTAIGAPAAARLVQAHGGKVFLDGKFDDIPNTVGAAARAAADLGVALFDVHASAGMAAMKAAVAHKGAARVLAVTVLTSLSDAEAQGIFGANSRAAVLRFARMAQEAGCDGIVCSPQELPFLADDPSLSGLMRVTPGVRPTWAAAGDQKRALTPAEAIRAGADALVIGRPITAPPPEIGGPEEAARAVAQEIADALQGKAA